MLLLRLSVHPGARKKPCKISRILWVKSAAAAGNSRTVAGNGKRVSGPGGGMRCSLWSTICTGSSAPALVSIRHDPTEVIVARNASSVLPNVAGEPKVYNSWILDCAFAIWHAANTDAAEPPKLCPVAISL